MEDNKFVPADTQCPQKPRGRKKAANKTKPSSPADTASNLRDAKGENVVVQPEKKRTRKSKAKNTSNAEPESIPAMSRPSAAACGFTTEGLTDSEVMEKLGGDVGLEPAPKRSKGEGKVSRKRKMCPPPMDNEDDVAHAAKVAKVKTSKSTKGKTKASGTGNAPSNETTNSGTASSSTPGNSDATTPTMTAKELQKVEQRKKQSRKSSAYHVAVRKAKNEGKTKEEQLAAGKAVSWRRL